MTVNGVMTLTNVASNSKNVNGRTIIHTNSSGSSTLNNSNMDLNNGAVFRNAAGAVLTVNASAGDVFIDHDKPEKQYDQARLNARHIVETALMALGYGATAKPVRA